MPRLNVSQPIVRPDRTMDLPFWQFILEVDKQIPIVGTGSPEGVVSAPYLSEYLDDTGADGLVSYRKMLPSIGGDKTQGWIKLSVPAASFEELDATGDIGSGADQLAAGDHDHPASKIVSGTFDDARISESSVTQHEGALTITESQISDLQNYLLAWVAPAFRNESSTSYTMVVGDRNKVIRFTGNNPAVTIPTGTFTAGDVFYIRQAGTGTLVLTTTSLTINGTVPGWAQHVEVGFRYVATDTYDVI